MIRINLHMHSTCSDGVCSPLELVRLLSKHRVSVASLTDHDTVEGVPAFLAACRKKKIRAVSGIELSSRHRGEELHILGYRFDVSAPGICRVAEQSLHSREERNSEICENLKALGFAVSMDEVRARAASRVVGRPHIAQVMADKGYVGSISEAFSRYLGRGAQAYVPRALLPSEEAVAIIREAGGFPVWAHPFVSLTDKSSFDSFLDDLQSFGLWGLECWFQGANPALTMECLMAAGRRGLYPTAGTDFHGRTGHRAKISGRLVEEDLLPWGRFCGGL